MINTSWVPHVLSMELRKIFSYRVDFWIQFMGSVLGELWIAYFLWDAVFQSRGVSEIGGYSLKGFMLYYVMIAFMDRLIRGTDWARFLSQEIYDGGLTRYLVYPVPYLPFKYVSHLAMSLVCAVQLLAAIGVFSFSAGIPPEMHITATTIVQAYVTLFFATYLYFSLAASLELVAFWADNVWSLMVMLRFLTAFLGGGLIPLTLFPESAQSVLQALPFSYLFSFPIRTLLGEISFSQWMSGLGVMAAWSLMGTWVTWIMWQRGTRQYSGVGM